MRIRDVPGVDSGPIPAKPFLAAYNGESSRASGGNYQVGIAASGDRVNWDTCGVPVIGPGSGWESTWVAQPSLVWDGSQFVIFYTGYNGTNLAIGRATASIFNGAWTKYASNPVVNHGSSGDPDEVGAGFPIVHYDPLDSPAWRMWYHAFPHGAGITNPAGLTVCYADSSDGISWTKHGTMIGVGTAGAFNDIGTDNGAVVKVGSTWYVFVSGYHSYSGSTLSKSGYCTTTDPATAADYSSLTQLTNYTGDITVGGRTWRSNQTRHIFANADGTYTAWLSLWAPTVTTTILETCVQVTSPDVISWGTPSQLMLAYDSWAVLSSENPSVLVAPV